MLDLKSLPYYFFYRTCYIKKRYLDKDAKTLVLGSSHGEYGWFPQQGEYNLCFASQDLYYSYQLYCKYAPKLPKLKRVILFFSVFSPGFELDKCSEKERCMVYDALFNIPPKNCFYKQNPYKNIRLRLKFFWKYLFPRAELANYRGECLDIKGKSVQRLETADVNDRVQKALKHNRRNKTGFEYINKLIAEANEHNQEVVIVLSPAHQKYKELVDKEITFDCRDDLLKSMNYRVIDGYQLDCFSDDDFWDFDHLRLDGAKKFTTIIRRKIGY